MPPRPEVVEFSRDSPAAVVAHMVEMSGGRNGWINLEPEVHEEDDAPESGGLFGFLSSQGPPVPLCTWSPSDRRVSIGVQHPAGPRAAGRLAELGHPVPAGWYVSQDHPRRGLVVEVPADEPPERVLDWLLAAGELLSRVPVTGRWHAAVFVTGR
ncbi:MAG: hypothetical protein E6G17_00150 [Actinobacteria bacterium]|nr:MAG: hypothetical protein E6G17_00150 [Actinomycetota bacterium]